MATLSVIIKTAKDTSDYKKAGQKHTNITKIRNLLGGLVSGALTGSIDLHSSTSDPVAAAGSVAITYGSVANNDTLVIAGVTLTCVTGTPTTDQFKKQTDATVTGDNLVTAIAANTTLASLVTASNAAGTVTITCKVKGLIGNQIKMSTSNGTGFGLTQLTGGTGGPLGTAETFGR